MKIVDFSLKSANKYFGRIDGGEEFFIGARVSFEGNKGLMNISGDQRFRYDRTAFEAEFPIWSDIIHPTAVVEGALFHTLNTYDRARFTFGFLQFAAHVPNGDFVLYLRALLELPQAAGYFPDLAVHDGRICRMTDDGAVPLESDSSTAALMEYLNPSMLEVEDTEVIQAAKFVHWAQNDPEHRKLQVRMGIDHFRTKIAGYARQYDLDGKDDAICVVVADIRHQGRARSPEIVAALRSGSPLAALLEIGEDRYPERVRGLRQEIALLTAQKRLGQRRYDLAQETFV